MTYKGVLLGLVPGTHGLSVCYYYYYSYYYYYHPSIIPSLGEGF